MEDRALTVGGLWMLAVAVSGLLAWLVIIVTGARLVGWLRGVL